MKQIMFFVIATVVVIFLVATGCTKNNPAGPGPACALCAQETETAIAIAAGNKTATATPIASPTSTATSTSVIVATATFTSTNVVGQPSPTATITPQSTVIWEIVITGTPGDTFTISYGVYNEATTLTTWTAGGTVPVTVTLDTNGNCNSLNVQTVFNVSDLFYQGVCDKILHVTVYRNGSIYGTSAPDPLQEGGNFSGNPG